MAPTKSSGSGAILDAWPDDDGTRAFLARTNRELLPALVVALRAAHPVPGRRVATPLEDPRIDELLAEVAATDPALPLLVRLGPPRRRRPGGSADPADDPDAPFTAASWPRRSWPGRRRSVTSTPSRPPSATAARSSPACARDDADLGLATAHATKGLEFDHVAVLGMEAGRFPSARSIADAEDPDRALEEERRLAYVAWTRARRTLTLSFDPDVASPFLHEAFDPDELPAPAA